MLGVWRIVFLMKFVFCVFQRLLPSSHLHSSNPHSHHSSRFSHNRFSTINRNRSCTLRRHSLCSTTNPPRHRLRTSLLHRNSPPTHSRRTRLPPRLRPSPSRRRFPAPVKHHHRMVHRWRVSPQLRRLLRSVSQHKNHRLLWCCITLSRRDWQPLRVGLALKTNHRLTQSVPSCFCCSFRFLSSSVAVWLLCLCYLFHSVIAVLCVMS